MEGTGRRRAAGRFRLSRRQHHARRLAKRRRLEALIERAIELLDQLDGDPDLEPEPRDDDREGEDWLQPVTLDRLLAHELRVDDRQAAASLQPAVMP